nr:UDP-glucose/GDP-mannose dehydrogenase family protein [Candidatus Methylacidithermus pantelleriae]
MVGSGYVGLTTGACFAELGHQVLCVDNDAEKVALLSRGEIPIYEPGLEELVRGNAAKGRLRFSTSVAEAVDHGLVIFLTVPTPPQPDGSVDLRYVEKVAREIARHLRDYRVIVDKSTVPVRTGEKVAQTIARYNTQGVDFDVVSNPEFLREGCAVHDLLHPDRIVIGVQRPRAAEIMKELYRPIAAPVVVTDLNSAELIKHASNSFLALKISYINALSQICERAGADVDLVAEGMGLDQRIGKAFLKAGIGYGGSCFPKDLAAFIRISEELGYDFRLLKEVAAINEEQKERFFKKIRRALWVLEEKTIGLLGLAFKANTDDVRNSVALELASRFLREGARVRAYDPVAGRKAQRVLRELEICEVGEEVARGADCVVIATEWDEFRRLDWARMRKWMISPLLFDGRNLLDPAHMVALGFQYEGVGRGLRIG